MTLDKIPAGAGIMLDANIVIYARQGASEQCRRISFADLAHPICLLPFAATQKQVLPEMRPEILLVKPVFLLTCFCWTEKVKRSRPPARQGAGSRSIK